MCGFVYIKMLMLMMDNFSTAIRKVTLVFFAAIFFSSSLYSVFRTFLQFLEMKVVGNLRSKEERHGLIMPVFLAKLQSNSGLVLLVAYAVIKSAC